MKLIVVCFLAALLVLTVTGATEGCGCPDDYKPVCGVNGRSYSNVCRATCKGVQVAYPGKCCNCQKIYDPVCGEDGKTYDNKCLAGCADVKVVSRKPCKEVCQCTREYVPVCGRDQKTYDNKCLATCAGQKIARLGPCTRPVCACTKELTPVCGADGKSYDNPCLAKCAKVAVVSEGYCKGEGSSSPPVEATCGPATSGSGCFCTQEYDPVCGCDGKTYSNACSASCVNIQVVSSGECDSEPTTAETPGTGAIIAAPTPAACGPATDGAGCICTQQYAPVCGCNNKTYSNSCVAECSNILTYKSGAC